MSTTTDLGTHGVVGEETGWATVARVVMPLASDEDTLPLYLDFGRAAVSAADSAGLTEAQAAMAEATAVSTSNAVGDTLRGEQVLSRRSVRMPAGLRTSFATYFNAFPASYWRAWTVVEQVRLRVRTSGEGSVLVYRSNATGRAQRVATRTVSGQDDRSTFELDLKTFGDGGWYWFDLVAGESGLVLEEADWQVAGTPPRPGTLSIGITTFNRADYCAKTIQALSEAEELRRRIDMVYVVDQGSQLVQDEPTWPAAAAALGDQLRLIRQGNLGGSGGFSRGMYESVRAGRSDYHMVLDDDVNIEPEGILRALDFAGYCRVPTIVGGHMFDLHNRSVLHAFGEEVNRWRFLWGSLPGLKERHDLSRSNLRATAFLHRRADVDYNGWWMCLIPTQVIREIGLSLPIFIKWDDAEYGLRAREAGYPTVSFPGAAVWHVSWIDKDDAVDWQAYYHERNRLLVGLLHSPYDHGGRLVRELFFNDVKHTISSQYYPQSLRVKAMKDILSGPDHLHRSIEGTMPELRAMAKEFDDSRYSADPDAYPLVDRSKPARKGRLPQQPNARTVAPFALKTAARHLLPTSAKSQERPQASIPHYQSKFWILSQYDSALVSKADGTGAAWYKRDPETFKALMAESSLLRARLHTEWKQLREQYRSRAAQLTSMEAWAQTFGIDQEGAPEDAAAVTPEGAPAVHPEGSHPESVDRTDPGYRARHGAAPGEDEGTHGGDQQER
ncbi:glycosyltransferase [Arsenicicoccus dermatophilus]|uniref:glycosyltransferase n=1 Tax=Arsenicicoccus dermatophilus TaxID=1076331 RepID=UPI0039173340